LAIFLPGGGGYLSYTETLEKLDTCVDFISAHKSSTIFHETLKDTFKNQGYPVPEQPVWQAFLPG
jgi:hypothetical protein